MATPTTLSDGGPTEEISADDSTVAANIDNSSTGNERDIYVSSDGYRPVTDFFAFSPITDDDEIRRYQQQFPDKTSDDVNAGGDNELTTFWGIFPEFRIRPCDVAFKIFPAIGAVCYEYFSLTVMDRHWFSRALGDSEGLVKDILWFQANLGASLYLFSRRHMRKVPAHRGVLYSVTGALLFNFGSLIVWGWGQAVLPNSPLLRSMFGLLTGGALLVSAQDYLQHVDDSCSELD